jgi:hypothetical protein
VRIYLEMFFKKMHLANKTLPVEYTMGGGDQASTGGQAIIPTDYPFIPIAEADYFVDDAELKITFAQGAYLVPFLENDLSFNIYYLYPFASPTTAALLGTYNVSGDLINYSGETPAVSSIPITLPVGTFDQATNQAFTTAGTRKLLILPYAYNSGASPLYGCPDPLPTGAAYYTDYYREVRTIMPLPATPDIASALFNSSDVIVRMTTPNPIPSEFKIFKGDTNVTISVTNTNFFTNGSWSYLYIDKSKNNAIGAPGITIGDAITITASNGIESTAASNSITVIADTLYNTITNTVDNNDSTFTLTLTNTTLAGLTYIVIGVDSAGVKTSAVPTVSGYTITYTKPSGADYYLFTQETETNNWSTPQAITIQPPPLIVQAALKSPTMNVITITMTDPGFTPSSINVYNSADESLAATLSGAFYFPANGKLYAVYSVSDNALVSGSAYKFAAVDTASPETGKSGSVTLEIDSEVLPAIGTPVNNGTTVTIPVTDTAAVTSYYIMSIAVDKKVTITSTGSSKTVSIPLPALDTTIYLLAQSTGGNSYILSTPLPVTIPPVTPPNPNPYVACFFATAPVLTPSGYKRIGNLAAGDKVMTGDGRVVAIERVHRSQVAAAPSTNPYVIPKGQYGATRRLQISPNHRVQTASGMIEARHMGLAQEELTGTLDYYNLELPATSDTMIVAGVTVESMAPVRRITVPFAVFREMITKKYGAMTPALIEKIKRTCRFLENGHVDCPGLASK